MKKSKTIQASLKVQDYMELQNRKTNWSTENPPQDLDTQIYQKKDQKCTLKQRNHILFTEYNYEYWF